MRYMGNNGHGSGVWNDTHWEALDQDHDSGGRRAASTYLQQFFFFIVLCYFSSGGETENPARRVSNTLDL